MVKVSLTDDSLIIELEGKYLTLSTTSYGGGLRSINTVVFTRVTKQFNEDPIDYSRNLLKKLSLPLTESIVFLTAADIHNRYVIEEDYRAGVTLAMTLGIDPIACVGGVTRRIKDDNISSHYGTINIFIAVNKPLSVRSLAELLMLASAVKALALTDLCLMCSDSRRAYSSAVDAIAVAGQIGSTDNAYVGPVTLVGSAISELIYKSIIRLALKDLDRNSRFNLLTGLRIDEIKRSIYEVYDKLLKVPNINTSEVKKVIDEVVNEELRDPNVWILLTAFKYPEILSSIGWIPGLSRSEYEADSIKIIADEVLGMTLSTYINGLKGLMSYYWLDRIKERISTLKDRPPFNDDLLVSFMGSIISKVLDRVLRR